MRKFAKLRISSVTLKPGFEEPGKWALRYVRETPGYPVGRQYLRTDEACFLRVRFDRWERLTP